MTDLRLHRLWRTSGILCTIGGVEFGYLAWTRQVWWPVGATVALLACAGLAFRRARLSRGPR
jgi:hypothetical protein